MGDYLPPIGIIRFGDIMEDIKQVSVCFSEDFCKLINDSKKILELSYDWDGNNAIQIKPNTWINAVDFIILVSTRIFICSGINLQTPNIDPCCDGSIDLHWKTNELNLLINIDPAGLGYSGFYGKTINGAEIKGKLHDKGNDLLRWLVMIMEQQNDLDEDTEGDTEGDITRVDVPHSHPSWPVPAVV
jgi:hypothetical protein